MSRTTDRAGSVVERAGKGRLKAAWTLVLLAPLCAEAAFTGISLPSIWPAFPLLVPVYGAGVLLIRELACRAGAGWAGLLVLGVAYELAEDGLGLQALTSPHLYTAAQWGRMLGFNITYWESQVGYHLVFSLLIPVALTGLIFKRHARRPYLGTFGLVGTAVVFAAGLALAKVSIAGSQDPGYQTPWPVVAALLAVIVVLGVVALVVFPRLRMPRPAPVARLPRPPVMATVAGIAPIVFLGLLFPLGHNAGRPAVGHGAWVALPMAAALVIAVAVGWRIAQWSASEAFTDRHRVWLIGGAMVGHSLFAVASGVAGGNAVLSPVLGLVVIAVTVLLLGRLDRRLAP
ncbi:hypothetical protein OG943_21255 [Amycolatopsis sp. NBC_00345]|uniref:hypothetical protein n=1 Tax=Amycolatopsis sp. NBC_00345 TaxID=2975955 RepID=UPI002E254574